MASFEKTRLAFSSALWLSLCIFLSGGVVAEGRTTRSSRPAANCAMTQVGLTALTDLGIGAYQGYEGGLYPDGENRPPLDYHWMGRAHAARVVPLNQAGQPDPNGRIVLLSIGMSNTTMEYSAFKSAADADPQKNPRVSVVDGAVGGQDAIIIRNPNASYWLTVTQRLTNAGVTPGQVEVVWLKEAIAGENRAFPADAVGLQDALRDIVGIIQTRFPNLQIVYLASRTYAGYATTTLNPEPYAYESAFAVKWLIGEKIVGNGDGPWLAWGPYIWTDGLRGRKDGFIWACADVQADGTHPSASGQQKIAQKLLAFLKTDEMAAPWFVRP